MPFGQRSLIHLEVWFLGGRKNTKKNDFFWIKEKINQDTKTQKRLKICQS